MSRTNRTGADLSETNQENQIDIKDEFAVGQDDSDEHVKTFGEHLEDLRWVLIKSLIVFSVVSIICFCFSDAIFSVFTRPIASMQEYLDLSNPIRLRALHPSEAFLMSLKISVVSGFILSLPVILYFVWEFLRPALTEKEKRLALPAFGWGMICFISGVLFCYFVILKLCLLFFWKYTISMGVEPEWTIGNYVSFVTTLLLAFGVTFELPVLCTLLAKIGLIDSNMLISKRAYAILIIFILAAILTPPDVFSQILLALPMIGLYEISICAVRVIERRLR